MEFVMVGLFAGFGLWTLLCVGFGAMLMYRKQTFQSPIGFLEQDVREVESLFAQHSEKGEAMNEMLDMDPDDFVSGGRSFRL